MAAEPTLSAVLRAIVGLSTRLGSLESELRDIHAHLKAQPDLRLVFANGKVTLEKIVEIAGEIRMLRSAINDHARENVTAGEMEAVHHDLTLIRHEQLASAARLQRIEAV